MEPWKVFVPDCVTTVTWAPESTKALTATQVRTHYNTGRCYKDAVLTDTPVGYWRLGESSGTGMTNRCRQDSRHAERKHTAGMATAPSKNPADATGGGPDQRRCSTDKTNARFKNPVPKKEM